MPFSGIALSSIFREFDVNVALCMTSAARPSPEAMQDAGPPMALFLTEIVSRKSEHGVTFVYSILERDLRPFWANIKVADSLVHFGGGVVEGVGVEESGWRVRSLVGYEVEVLRTQNRGGIL